MKRREIDLVLRDAGSQDPPPPRPEFVRDLESRFGTTRVVTVTAPRHTARWAAAGVAAAAVIAGAFVLAHHDQHDEGVTTLPTSPPATTTLTTGAATTVVLPPSQPTTTTTTRTSTTVTTVPPPTTTTTSTTAAPQDLGLHCSTNPSTLAVVCEWSTSADPAFDHFRLWKHTGDGPAQELYAGTATRFEDHESSGARMYYEVTALAADGRELGHGRTYIVCC